MKKTILAILLILSIGVYSQNEVVDSIKFDNTTEETGFSGNYNLIPLMRSSGRLNGSFIHSDSLVLKGGLSNYVTLDTNETITGRKSFRDNSTDPKYTEIRERSVLARDLDKDKETSLESSGVVFDCLTHFNDEPVNGVRLYVDGNIQDKVNHSLINVEIQQKSGTIALLDDVTQGASENTTAIQTEVSDRISADSVLQGNIDLKTDSGGYTGTAQSLKDDMDSRQFEGLINYQTKSLLDAVSPIPSEGTPAKVVNDTDISLNGGYSVTGGVWVKDYQSNKNEIDESNTVDGVTGYAVSVGLETKADLVKSKNIFTLENVINGKYVQWTNGAFIFNATYSHTSYIEIEPSTVYTLSVDIGNIHQFALYDSLKAYTGGNIGSLPSVTFTTGANDKYIAISLPISKQSDLYQLEKGTERTDYVTAGYVIDVNQIPYGFVDSDFLSEDLRDQINSVSKTAVYASDFDNVRLAVESCTDSTLTYEVFINEGEHDILSFYTDAEIQSTTFKGLDIANNVFLTGIGDGDKVILKGYLESSYQEVSRSRVSTLNFIESGGLKNLTVTGENIRYAVHDDINIANAIRIVENCNFIKYNGNANGQAYGGGTRSGCYYYFKNSKFHTDRRVVDTSINMTAVSFHNNVNFNRKSRIVFEDCEMTSYTGAASAQFGSLGSGVTDEIVFKNCYLQGWVVLSETSGYAGVGIDFKVSGSGNTDVPVKVIDSTNSDYVYGFAENVKTISNKSTSLINKGDLVQLTSSNQGVEALNNEVLFCGISLQDIDVNESGKIRSNGYLRVEDTSLIGLSVGDKIGIVNNELAIVTTGDYIGFVALDGFIKLK